jgi:transposase InsO family protein
MKIKGWMINQRQVTPRPRVQKLRSRAEASNQRWAMDLTHFRSLKEECVWQHNFETFQQASEKVDSWIRWYNRERPHQALRYQSPEQFRKRRPLVA